MIKAVYEHPQLRIQLNDFECKVYPEEEKEAMWERVSFIREEFIKVMISDKGNFSYAVQEPFKVGDEEDGPVNSKFYMVYHYGAFGQESKEYDYSRMSPPASHMSIYVFKNHISTIDELIKQDSEAALAFSNIVYETVEHAFNRSNEGDIIMKDEEITVLL